jgi:hypothetical protein
MKYEETLELKSLTELYAILNELNIWITIPRPGLWHAVPMSGDRVIAEGSSEIKVIRAAIVKQFPEEG